MVLPTVINRAVDAVRAYFQRDLHHPPMNVFDIPPVAAPVMSLAYALLATVFALLALVSTFISTDSSGCLCDGLWIISKSFCVLSAAILWPGGFILFQLGCFSLIYKGMVVSIITTSSRKFAMYHALIGFLGYATLYSEVMMERIVLKGDENYVKHAAFLFLDSPYVFFRIGRIYLKTQREGLLLIFDFIRSSVLRL